MVTYQEGLTFQLGNSRYLFGNNKTVDKIKDTVMLATLSLEHLLKYSLFYWFK